MKKVLIVKCGDTYPDIVEKFGGFEQWILNRANLPDNTFKVYDLPKGEYLRHPEEFAATIITGSHSNVDEPEKWIGHLKKWIVEARYCHMPILGICFGAQIIAEALGGKVEYNTKGLQYGATSINVTTKGMVDPLFRGVGDSFESYSYHHMSVFVLPPGAEVIAFSETIPIQAYRLNNIYGVQFHPEMNAEIMKMYIDHSGLLKSVKNKAKIKSDYKNQAIISNYLNIVMKNKAIFMN